MTSNTNILISGAGIAGLTLAYWLQKFGFSPTIIENRPNLDHEGYMIDFYGSGFDVAEKMGLTESLRARHYDIPNLAFVDSQGKPQASMNIEEFRKILDYRHFNFMRGDLESVLYKAVKDTIPIHFQTSIQQINPQPDTVQVEFSDGKTQNYDLVIGADGIHSNVRNLLWGHGNLDEHFLGFYVACGVIENFLDAPDIFFGHFEPGTQVSVYAIRDNQLATFFAFKMEQQGIKERQQQFDALKKAFGKQKWIVPKLVDATIRSPYFYFDAVAQIKLTPWYKNRVALVGDACQCLTLLAGQGASMAMAGAYLLADELQKANGDYQIAFPAYQDKLKPEIAKRQIEAQKLAGSFVPKNQFSIWVMYTFLKMAFLPGFRSIFKRQIGAQSIIH